MSTAGPKFLQYLGQRKHTRVAKSMKINYTNFFNINHDSSIHFGGIIMSGAPKIDELIASLEMHTNSGTLIHKLQKLYTNFWPVMKVLGEWSYSETLSIRMSLGATRNNKLKILPRTAAQNLS